MHLMFKGVEHYVSVACKKKKEKAAAEQKSKFKLFLK